MLLIDAFNVLHLPEAVQHGRAIDLAGLVGLIGSARYAGQRVILVCDGGGDGSITPPRGRRGRVRVAGVEVVFSGPDRSADDEIEARLLRGGGHGVVVVSDDRRLRRAAARVRSRSLASGAFLAHLLSDERRPRSVPRFARETPLDRYSVAHWMEAFGLSPEGLLDRRAGRAERGAGGTETVPASPTPSEAGEWAVPIPDAQRGVAGGTGGGPEAGAVPDERVLRMERLADDPVIREALKAWRGRLTLDDLDMARWLSEHPPGGRDQR